MSLFLGPLFGIGFPGLFILTAILWVKQRKANTNAAREANERILELERLAIPMEGIHREIDRLEVEILGHTSRIFDLKASYSEKKQAYDQLVDQLASVEERHGLIDIGLYEPHFDFTDSEQYRKAVLECRADQKRMISEKKAVICATPWSLDGSAAKGQTMANRQTRLTLRAFNNECDAAIANARWNNIATMEKRILSSQLKINDLNELNAVTISREYANLKLRELFLVHEQRLQLKSEREEKTDQARAAREEAKLQQDMDEAAQEEAHYRKMLEEAKAEASAMAGPTLDAFNEKIRLLETDLAAANDRLERAQTMAERTKCGYVYVISNVGSFGENVIKIGLTRRLDPEDRIRELGDASVPFLFDIHAIIHSEDAPALESALHAEFENKRVNSQNMRKQFFRASIDDVEAAVKKIAPSAQFFKDIEAQEYRETLAKRSATLSIVPDLADLLPEMV